MAGITQISRIQIRRGLEADLPQLASGELGWAIDTQKLFIGNGTLGEGAPLEGNTELTGAGGGVTNYLRDDVDDVTAGSLGIENDNGLYVGEDGPGADIHLYVVGNDSKLDIDTAGGSLTINLETPGDVLTFDGTTGLATVKDDPTAALGIATKQYVDANGGDPYMVSSYAGAVPTAAGTESAAIGSGATAAGNNSVAIGASASAATNNTIVLGTSSETTIAKGKLQVDKAIHEKAVSISYTASGTTTIDTSLGSLFYSTVVTAGTTWSFTNPASAGYLSSFVLVLTDADAFTQTWPASVAWVGGTEPTWVSGVNVITFFTRDGGTTWYGSSGGGAGGDPYLASSFDGTLPTATGIDSLSIGEGAICNGDSAIVIGQLASANAGAPTSIVIGYSAEATVNGNTGITIGYNSTVDGANSMALGPAASVTANNAVAIGNMASNAEANTIALGTSTETTITKGKLRTDKAIHEKAVSVSYTASGTTTIDTSLGSLFYSTVVTAGTTWAFTNPASSGYTTTITLELTNANLYTQTWPASVSWVSGTAPTWGAGVNVIVFYTRDAGTTWYGMANTTDASATSPNIQTQAYTRFTAGGTADAITGTLSPSIAAYTTGLRVSTTVAANTIVAPTLNLNSLGVKTIKKMSRTGSKESLAIGDYNASGPMTLEYDGTDFVLLNPQTPSGVYQNSQSANYTTVLADAQKHILHPSADTSARTFTIDSNANVPYPIGTALTFINQNGGGTITIAITSDTMRLAGAGTTGSRTLAANGIATAIKITSTEWIISGTGLT